MKLPTNRDSCKQATHTKAHLAGRGNGRIVANCDFQLGWSFQSSKGACLHKSQAATAAEAGEGGGAGALGASWAGTRSHISSSLLPSAPLQGRKQCRWRREINIPACSVPLQTFSKMSGLDHEIKPTQERRRSAGERGGKGGIFVDTCQLSGGQSTWLILGSPAEVETW